MKSDVKEANEVNATNNAVENESSETVEKEVKKEISSRVFNIMQYEKHPETNEILLTEEKIKDVLEKRKSIKQWAWIIHDKDTNEDGTLKAKHFHIVIRSERANKLSDVAKWFDIGKNYIEVPKGRNAFLDCVSYLTHSGEKQQKAGKHLYSDDEVKANFDWLKAIENANKRKETGEDKEIVDAWIVQVSKGEKKLEDCFEENAVLYIRNKRLLDTAHKEYLNSIDVPKVRLNFYIYGKGGTGKGLMSRALARSLYPDLKDDELFFEVGGDKSIAFSGYKQQPVIIWNDVRVIDLFESLGGRGNVFDIFDTTPTSRRQNIKYGDVRLMNSINIVNSVTDYIEFLDRLAGEYVSKSGEQFASEDKNQSYRRFPIIIPIRDEDFDFYLNKGFMSGNVYEYEQYHVMKNVGCNLKTLVGIFDGGAYRRIEREVCEPVVVRANELIQSRSERISELTEEHLNSEWFKKLGKSSGEPTTITVTNEFVYESVPDEDIDFG